MKICECGGRMEESSWFRAFVCYDCGKKVVDKNENWIEEVSFDPYYDEKHWIWELENKVNEIIRVLNKITNPEVKE